MDAKDRFTQLKALDLQDPSIKWLCVQAPDIRKEFLVIDDHTHFYSPSDLNAIREREIPIAEPNAKGENLEFCIKAKNFIALLPEFFHEKSDKKSTAGLSDKESVSLLLGNKRKSNPDELPYLLQQKVKEQFNDPNNRIFEADRESITKAISQFRVTETIKSKMEAVTAVKALSSKYGVDFDPVISKSETLEALGQQVLHAIDTAAHQLSHNIVNQLPEYLITAMMDNTPILPSPKLFSQFTSLLFPDNAIKQEQLNDQYQGLVRPLFSAAKQNAKEEERIESPSAPKRLTPEEADIIKKLNESKDKGRDSSPYRPFRPRKPRSTQEVTLPSTENKELQSPADEELKIKKIEASHPHILKSTNASAPQAEIPSTEIETKEVIKTEPSKTPDSLG